MCGIVGLLRRSPDTPGDDLKAQAGRMAATLLHRGPDDAGTWVDAAAGVALGFRRLSILDLSAAGAQPMVSASGRYVVTFNGEIYNFAELREALGPGIAYRGHSDTEVLLAAIEAWGVEAALRRSVGMFALGLWDRHERRLTLARDHMGEKPLYYAWNGALLLFGSELKALRAHPAWEPRIDRTALPGFLDRGWIGGPATIYESCRKLPPGHLAEWRPADSWPVASRPYWDFAAVAAAGPNMDIDETEAEQGLERLLRQAITGQIVADVPVGAFLSGGIDSTSIVALMQEQSRRPARTFTIGFEERRFDEAPFARTIAAHLGTEHTELYVSPAEARAVIPQLAEIYDEPFADPSQIPTVLLARLARRTVMVSLSGDGGDELLGGYGRYFTAARTSRAAAWLPGSRGLGRGLQRFAAHRFPAARRAAKLGAFLAAENATARHATLMALLLEPGRMLRGGELAEAAQSAPPATANDIEAYMALDAVTYLPDNVLVKLDRAAMAASLETRAPFLDHRVVEFACRLPLRYKVRDGRGKWLLRRLLARRVPARLWERPKMGFAVPVGSWLRGPLRDWAEDLIGEARLRREGYLEPAAVRRLWELHRSGDDRLDHAIWAVLMFQSWLAIGSVSA